MAILMTQGAAEEVKHADKIANQSPDLLSLRYVGDHLVQLRDLLCASCQRRRGYTRSPQRIRHNQNAVGLADELFLSGHCGLGA
jgi:sulfur relay (sulfurtransferase) complex TusBCD TusD component (DsrE family)